MSATASQRWEPPTERASSVRPASDLAGAEPDDLGGHPGRGVHPVRHGGDRHVGGVEARPQPGEHLPADGAVQGGDPVGPLGQAQPHDRHVEHAGVAPGVGLGAEFEDPLDRYALQFPALAEVPGDQGPLEAVDARGDGGVRGEDGPGADGFDGGVETEALLPFQFPYAFEPEEAGVSLVGVEHLGVGVAGQLAVEAYGADAADAEEHLLEQPVVAAASVEPVGHLAGRAVVVLDVGVQQQQGHPADAGPPDVRVQGPAAGEGQRDPGGGAVGLAHEVEGQLVGIEDGVLLLLPAVAGERLAEVAVPVEQSHADERDSEVAGGLQVVPGEDAEAAGVLGQGGGDTELGGEIGDPGGQAALGLVSLVPPPAGHVVIEVGCGGGEPPQEAAVGGQFGQPGGGHGTEEPDGIAVGGLPALGVDGLEEFAGLGMPRPAQIAREVVERQQGLREDGAHGESTDSLHTFHLRRGLRIGAAAPRCAPAHHPRKASETDAFRPRRPRGRRAARARPGSRPPRPSWPDPVGTVSRSRRIPCWFRRRNPGPHRSKSPARTARKGRAPGRGTALKRPLGPMRRMSRLSYIG